MNKNYFDLLEDPRWQKKRLEILQRDRFTCQKCQDKRTNLHIHHLKYLYNKNPWEIDNKYLITLCADCHFEIEYITKHINEKINLSDIKIGKAIGDADIKMIFTSFKNSLFVTQKIKSNIKFRFILEGDGLNELKKVLNK